MSLVKSACCACVRVRVRTQAVALENDSVMAGVQQAADQFCAAEEECKAFSVNDVCNPSGFDPLWSESPFSLKLYATRARKGGGGGGGGVGWLVGLGCLLQFARCTGGKKREWNRSPLRKENMGFRIFHHFLAALASCKRFSHSTHVHTHPQVLGQCLLSASLTANTTDARIRDSDWFVSESAIADPANVCGAGEYFGLARYKYWEGQTANTVGCHSTIGEEEKKCLVTSVSDQKCKVTSEDCTMHHCFSSTCYEKSLWANFDLLNTTERGCAEGLKCQEVPDAYVTVPIISHIVFI